MNSSYASIIGVFASPRDFKVQFRDLVPVMDENGTITGQEVSCDQIITMSPVTAKELIIILGDQIKAYEQQHGEIQTFLTIPHSSDLKNE